MVQYFEFYKPVYNPTGLTGIVGGAISSEVLHPRKDALFASRDSSSVASLEQYRKFFIKQVYATQLTGLVVELAYSEHADQIYFGIPTGDVNESISSPTVSPTGVALTGTYSGNIPITGITNLGSVIPIWIKQVIPADSGDDDFVTFQLRIIGTVL